MATNSIQPSQVPSARLAIDARHVCCAVHGIAHVLRQLEYEYWRPAGRAPLDLGRLSLDGTFMVSSKANRRVSARDGRQPADRLNVPVADSKLHDFADLATVAKQDCFLTLGAEHVQPKLSGPRRRPRAGGVPSSARASVTGQASRYPTGSAPGPPSIITERTCVPPASQPMCRGSSWLRCPPTRPKLDPVARYVVCTRGMEAAHGNPK